MKTNAEQSANVNYDGQRRGTINATVRAPELAMGLAKQKEEFSARIASHAEYQRVKRGTKTLKHALPEQEVYAGDGVKKIIKETTTTQRRNN